MLESLSFSLFFVLQLLSPPLPMEIAIASLEKDYQLEIVPAQNDFLVKTHWGTIWGKKSSGEDIKKYVHLLVRELRIYPPALLKKAKVTRIVLCEGLIFDRQFRNAVPDFSNNTYYLEIKRGAKNPRYLSLVFHHDLFHFLDAHDDGQLYRDERWSALNRPTFEYGSGGKNSQNNPATNTLTDRYPGFLNHYSTTGVEEDKAEIFAHLLINSTYVDSRLAKDAILRRKVERMKELVKTICPDCGDEFWIKSSKIDRPK